MPGYVERLEPDNSHIQKPTKPIIKTEPTIKAEPIITEPTVKVEPKVGGKNILSDFFPIFSFVLIGPIIIKIGQEIISLSKYSLDWLSQIQFRLNRPRLVQSNHKHTKKIGQTWRDFADLVQDLSR